jgi:hypothetical protein
MRLLLLAIMDAAGTPVYVPDRELETVSGMGIY